MNDERQASVDVNPFVSPSFEERSPERFPTTPAAPLQGGARLDGRIAAAALALVVALGLLILFA